MKLVLIRHAEPDYTIDSLTKKGFREAKLLAERTKAWRVSQFYCSPLGRAQQTALPTLTARGIELTSRFPEMPADVLQEPDASKAIVYPWLREFHTPIDRTEHPFEQGIPWDLSASFLNQNPVLYDPLHWQEAPFVQKAPIYENYQWITARFDALLALHGYERDGLNYRTDGTHAPSDHYMKYDGTTLECLKLADTEEPVLVIFCHLGVMMTLISHLIHTSPYTLWQGCFVPTSSVTVLSTEERISGEALFRIQMLGDTSHLRFQQEPVSYYGGFATPFQG